MIRWLALLAFLAPSFAMAQLRTFEGNIQLENGNSIFVKTVAPRESAPTIVFFNGLTDRLQSWDSLTTNLVSRGYGIVAFDFMGQGRTLLSNKVPTKGVAVWNQVEDVRELLSKLEVQEPIHLAGFSYGGGIAQAYAARYPQSIATLTLMAPFTTSIESQDAYFRWQAAQHRILFPFDTREYDEIYDQYLRTYVFSNYPLVEPALLEPFRLEGVFRLVQGVRHFNSFDVIELLPKGKLHLIIGTFDQLIPRKMQDEFWERLPRDVRASRLLLEGVEHRIPLYAPNGAARWIHRIVSGDPEISNGRTFTLNPWMLSSQNETEAR